jgi:hypothetical protein
LDGLFSKAWKIRVKSFKPWKIFGEISCGALRAIQALEK